MIKDFSRERINESLKYESDTVIYKENDLRERYFELFQRGINDGDLSEFISYLSNDVQFVKLKWEGTNEFINEVGFGIELVAISKRHVVLQLQELINKITNIGNVSMKTICNFRPYTLCDNDKTFLVGKPVYEFDKDKMYLTEYKNRKMLLITDNTYKVINHAMYLDLNDSGNIVNIELVPLIETCEFEFC